jgi:hypothetical protein
MSEVTTVVLICSGFEEDSLDVPPPPIAALQAWLRREDLGQLVSVDRLFGGRKGPQVVCFGGAFNHMDVAGFTAVFREQDWRRPEQVVLILTTEEQPSIVLQSSRSHD